MPKQNYMRGKKVLGNKTVKFRVGNRKTGVSAHGMSESDLRAKLGSRYHSNVVHVLHARGLEV